jgi:membrane dipeptidase
MTSTTPVSQAALELHREAFVADLHCDLLLTTRFLGWRWGRRHRRNPLPGAPLMGQVDLPRLAEGGVDCLCLGVVTPKLPILGGPRSAQWAVDRMHREATLAPHRIVITRSAVEARRAKAAGRLVCMAGLEGTHCLNGDLSPLEGWARQGMLYMGLVHFDGAGAGQAQRPVRADRQRGLTPWGVELVREANRVGLLVDVAHLNAPGVQQVCREARLPVLCSHTAMRAVHDSWRAIDDAEALAVARTGGLVGIIFASLYLGGGEIDAVVAQLSHLRKVVGAEHCAIGTDWEGWVTYPRGLGSAEGLPRLTQALLRAGWPEQDVAATLGNNLLRVLDALGEDEPAAGVDPG